MAKLNMPKEGSRSSSNRVPRTAYYQGGGLSSNHSPFDKKPAAKKSLSSRLTGPLIILVLLLVFAYCSIVSGTPKVFVSDLSYAPKSKYQAAATQVTAGILNRNKLTFDEKGISEKLQKQFSEASSVSVNLSLFSQRPTIKFNIAPPTLVLRSTTGDFIINGQGRAASTAHASISKGLPIVIDQSGFKIKAGDQALSTDQVDFIRQILAQAKQSKIVVSSLVLPALPQEIDVHTTDQPYFVKFYFGANPTLQLGEWLAARHQFAQSHVTPTAYLDVRVAGKIFYK